MYYRNELLSLIRNFIPPSAEVIILEEPAKRVGIIIEDIDGDKSPEIIVAYRWEGKPYIIILKCLDNYCYMAARLKGNGYGVNYLGVAPFTGSNTNALIIGWQVGSIRSELGIYEWEGNMIKDLLNEDIYYSKIDVEDMPTGKGRDGKYEIALWTHDTGEAYKVEVYRWQDGRLVPAPDAYPYYFKRVVKHYEKQVEQLPEAAFYWYYLADALFKTKEYSEALKAIETAIRLNKNYPSKRNLLKLKSKIEAKLQMRGGHLYSASVKTIDGVKWGFIDSKGNMIIEPDYDYAYDFQENGLAIASKGNKNGIINEIGKYVVEPKYDTITQFSEGRSIVVDSSGFKVIDEQGREVTGKTYNFIGSYQKGRAVAGSIDENEKYVYGYLDREGKEVIPLIYEYVSDFNNGKAIVKVDENEYALIGLMGEKLNSYKYAFVGNLSDGLLVFQPTAVSKYGYIDESGSIIIPPRFSSALPFKDGRAVVNVAEDYSNNKYGLIDKNDSFVIEPEYNDVNVIGQDRVAVGKAINEESPFLGSMYAVADINGKFLTDFIYGYIADYKRGYASTCDDNNTFFIDINGKVVTNLPVVSGCGTLAFEGELIRAFVNNRISYYDKSGKLVWEPNNTIKLNDQYSVLEEKYSPNKDYHVYYPQIEGIKDKNIRQAVDKRLKELSQVKEVDPDIQLDYNYGGDFSVEFFKNDLLVLELNGYEFYYGAAHGMPSKIYPHIDLVSGRFYELKDLFKENSNYVQVLSDIIGKQIKNNEEYSYVFPDAYKGIEPDQYFYVDSNNLYIYFYPYDIGPYAAGFPTFKIAFKDIVGIIDVRGEFWRAFN